MIDYSTQDTERQRGAHPATINAVDFVRLLPGILSHNLDVMLEIKDKETSTLTALDITGIQR